MPDANPFAQFIPKSGPAAPAPGAAPAAQPANAQPSALDQSEQYGFDLSDAIGSYVGEEVESGFIKPAEKLWTDVTQTPIREQQDNATAARAWMAKRGIDPKKASYWDWVAANAAGRGFGLVIPGVSPDSRDIPRIIADAAGVPLSAMFSPLHAFAIRPAAEALSRVYLPPGMTQQEAEAKWENALSLAVSAVAPEKLGSPGALRRLPKPPPDSGAAAANSAARRMVIQGGLGTAKSGERVRKLIAEHRATGAGEPTVLDVLPSSGKRVVRAAGAKMGEGDDLLEAHRAATRADIGAKTVQRTEDLTPHHEDVETRIGLLEARRDKLAEEEYREPYSQPIQTDERLFDILDSPSAIQSIGEARVTAKERMLDDPTAAQQFHELGALRQYFDDRAAYESQLEDWKQSGGGTFAQKLDKKARALFDNPQTAPSVKDAMKKEFGWKPTPRPEEPKFPTVSGGTLDRIRIAMRDKATTLAKAGRNARAGGVGDRYRALDGYLDNVPHLRQARATYRDISTQIEQLEFDRNLQTMRPEAFKSVVAKLNPAQRQELVHSVAEKLATHFGTSARAAQAEADIFTTSPNMQANLRTLLGDEVANNYIRAIQLMGERLKAATFASSMSGSRTAILQTDIAETSAHVGLQLIMGHGSRAIYSVARFLVNHNLNAMNEAEARQIAEWAVSSGKIEDTLQAIMDAAEKKPPKKDITIPRPIMALLQGYLVTRPSTEPRDGAKSDDKPDADTADPTSAAMQDPNNPFHQFLPGQKGAQPAAAAPPADSSEPDPVATEPTAYEPNDKVATYLGGIVGVPVSIHSGPRDAEHNKEVGGVPNSAHLKGEAWDFSAEGMSNEEAADKIIASGIQFDQLEITPTHLHISFDPRNRQQVIRVGGGSRSPAGGIMGGDDASGIMGGGDDSDFSAFAPDDTQ